MARLVLPQALGNPAATYVFSPCGILDAEDQRVLGHPALVAPHHRGDAQREALLAEQRVAAVARADTTRSRGPRESARCTSAWRCTATCTSSSPGASGLPTECMHGTKSPSPSASIDRAPHARHDAHVDDDIRRIGQFDADVRQRRPDGPIENGITYIVRPRMQPSKSPCSVSRISRGSTQLLVGPASCLR